MDDIGSMEVLDTAEKVVESHDQVTLLELTGVGEVYQLLQVRLEVLHDDEYVVTSLRCTSRVIDFFVRSVNQINQFWTQYISLFSVFGNLTHDLDFASNFDAVVFAVVEVFDKLDCDHLFGDSTLAKFYLTERALSEELDQFIILLEMEPDIPASRDFGGAEFYLPIPVHGTLRSLPFK